MNFHYEQPDGSVFIGKCSSWWNPFRRHHLPVHDLTVQLPNNDHLVTCQRCKLRGYAANRAVMRDGIICGGQN